MTSTDFSQSRSQRRAWAFAWLIFWVGLSALSIRAGDSETHDLAHTLKPPTGWLHWGTEAFGRELLPLVASAAGRTLGISVSVALLSLVFGTFIGGCGPLLGRRLEALIERAVEAALALPPMIPALFLATFLGSTWSGLLLSMLVGLVPGFARVAMIRSRELSLEGYVGAAFSLGSSPLHVYRRHVLPSLLELALLKLPNGIAGAILAEATLTFIGIGAPRQHETWGSLLLMSRDYLLEAPWVAGASALPLLLTLLSLNTLLVSTES